MAWTNAWAPRVPVTSIETVEAFLARGGQITVCEPAYVAPSSQYHWTAADIVVALPEPNVTDWQDIPGTATVEILVKTNPHNPDSMAFEQFDNYRNGATISYLRNRVGGINRKRLLRDCRQGYVKLNGAPELELPSPKPKQPRPPRQLTPWPGLPQTAGLTPLVDWSNRPGWAAHRRWLLYSREEMTVGLYRAEGGPRRALAKDVQRGWVKLDV
jgi:hypothetical protein